jgi:AcrR family transcriptional regulator
VFHHFEDMEALFGVAAQRQMQRHLRDIGHVPREGPLAARLDAFVASRSAVLEAISPVRRSALLSEPASPVIAKHLAWIRHRGRKEVERVFASELARRPAAARKDLLEALTAVSSWPAWETLRAHQALPVTQARRVMRRALSALLEQE